MPKPKGSTPPVTRRTSGRNRNQTVRLKDELLRQQHRNATPFREFATYPEELYVKSLHKFLSFTPIPTLCELDYFDELHPKKKPRIRDVDSCSVEHNSLDQCDTTHPSHLPDITNSAGDLEGSCKTEKENPIGSKEETETRTEVTCKEVQDLSSSTQSISSDFAKLKQDETITPQVSEEKNASDTFLEEIPVDGLDELITSFEKKSEVVLDLGPTWKWTQGTFINCDLRYFSLSRLQGDFDVVLVDPPWRTDDLKYEYNTLTNQEIMDIDVASLSQCGFCFLWSRNTKLSVAFECLTRWGYQYCDRIVWVKKTPNGALCFKDSAYFLQCTETCLVGVKTEPKNPLSAFQIKVSNDLILAPPGKKYEKPNQLYDLIEFMCPRGRKVELFARNNNIRKGWLSLGHELGQHFNWEQYTISCDNCTRDIVLGTPRYKSKKEDKDLCEKCAVEDSAGLESFFKLENTLDEMPYHRGFECAVCKVNPLWGLRFTCKDCSWLHLCEECYDEKKIPEECSDKHLPDHQWDVIEVPVAEPSQTVHIYKCNGCDTHPIIGHRFVCLECSGVNLCQSCLFAKKEPKGHLSSHRMDLVLEQDRIHAYVKCDICQQIPIIGPRYKCDICSNYDICEECFLSKEEAPAGSCHRPFHTFSKISGDVTPEFGLPQSPPKRRRRRSSREAASPDGPDEAQEDQPADSQDSSCLS